MNISVYKVVFSSNFCSLSQVEYVLGTGDQAEEYAKYEASSLGVTSVVSPVKLEGNQIQLKNLLDSKILKILCN